MIKKAFIGLTNSWLSYDRLPAPPPPPAAVPQPPRLTFHLETTVRRWDTVGLRPGGPVARGQLISLGDESTAAAVATAGGRVAAVAPGSGDFNRPCTAVTIEADPQADGQLAAGFTAAAAAKDLETAWPYLAGLPGRPPFEQLLDARRPIDTIVINGVDGDLLVTTAQHTVQTRMDAIKRGIERLRELTTVEKILIVVQRDDVQTYGHIGAVLHAVDSRYPSGHPHCVMRSVLGREVPAGKCCEDLGVCFFSAEAVASIGDAAEGDTLPADKLLTLIDKQGRATMISARIGTPVGRILEHFELDLDEGDRLIFGGPMTGRAVHSLDQPVEPDTDAIMIQACEEIPHTSDYPCINCGECIRVCPADIAVNMLVRFLEAGQYEEAAELYDLTSCIECGLCSFVCVSKIPIFQHITLGKYELARTLAAEDSDE